MSKILFLLLVASMLVYGKPKRKEFRIVVMPKNGFTIYVPEYREKRGILSPEWHPITPFYYYDLQSAKQIVEDMKFEDSLYVINATRNYIYFK